MVMNPRVNRYLRINNPDILEHQKNIVDIDNLNAEELSYSKCDKKSILSK